MVHFVELLARLVINGIDSLKLMVGFYALAGLFLAPLWVMLYRHLRKRTVGGELASAGSRWVQGFLAWGIVATHALFDRRYRPYVRRSGFLLLNLAITAGAVMLFFPQLGGGIVLVSSLSAALIITISVTTRRRRGRGMSGRHYSTPACC